MIKNNLLIIPCVSTPVDYIFTIVLLPVLSTYPSAKGVLMITTLKVVITTPLHRGVLIITTLG